jgi:quercetin dioxygenase-like cupin family protein
MAIAPAQPGEVVNVRPLGPALASAQTATLFRAGQVEVRRLVVPAGKEIAEHKAKGEIVVHCLEGRVAYTAFGKTHHLEAGKLLYLPTGEPHSVKGIEDASLLLTILASPWRKCRTAGSEAVCSERSTPWAKPKATALRRSSLNRVRLRMPRSGGWAAFARSSQRGYSLMPVGLL